MVCFASQSFLPYTHTQINAVLVNREPGVLLPPEVQRGSRSSLPIGILLAPQVEIVVLPVRFELPAGVKLQPGAVLGRWV